MIRKYQPKTRYELTTHAAVILSLLILFVSVSYFFFIAKPDERARQIEMSATLKVSKEAWASQHPARFRYVVDRACDCPTEVSTRYIVTERTGQREAVFPIPVESSAGILITIPTEPVWIEDIFGKIEAALDRGIAIEVRYHPRYGFPEHVIIRQDENGPGAFEQYEIRDFEVFDAR
jgi:hypothetical protein